MRIVYLEMKEMLLPLKTTINQNRILNVVMDYCVASTICQALHTHC